MSTIARVFTPCFGLVFAVFATGCTTDPIVQVGESPDGFHRALSLLPEPNPDIDILFVIDNSGSMMEEQASLANWAQEYLFGVLELEVGVLPNIHIGVVSTDLGADTFQIASCEGPGDDGVLQDAPRVPGCVPPSDPYISDIETMPGTRERNYTEALGDTFACIARLGVDGCGFEQPLEAMRRALQNPANSGFLRPDALLAVVFVTDEDDCSAIDRGLFDPSQTDPNSPLGPMSSFRCFEFGVTCNEPDPRSPGVRTGCTAGTSAYMSDVAPYVDFLTTLKPNPNMVMVAGIFGDRTPVEVSLDPETQNPQLEPSCTGTVSLGVANPGVRMGAFLDGFPGRNQFASICDDDLAGPLQSIASFVGGQAARTPCLRGDLADSDSQSPGVQPECRVYEVFDLGQPNQTQKEIPRCTESRTDGCYSIESDTETCSLTRTQLLLQAPTSGGDLIADCRSAR